MEAMRELEQRLGITPVNYEVVDFEEFLNSSSTFSSELKTMPKINDEPECDNEDLIKAELTSDLSEIVDILLSDQWLNEHMDTYDCNKEEFTMFIKVLVDTARINLPSSNKHQLCRRVLLGMYLNQYTSLADVKKELNPLFYV